MFVVTRKKDEKIVIGTNPQVTVTFCKRNRDGSIRLGVDAPRDIPVDREEVYLERKRRMDAKDKTK